MVKATRPNIHHNGSPDNHCSSPFSPVTLKALSWARKMTMARPFTNPNITGSGTIRINLPNRNTPARICRMPINTTVANKYSTPCCATNATITTANAPVAPEIIPGRPPIAAVISPTRNAAYKPTKGSTPATKAKATASGTSAKATVSPDNTSFFMFCGRFSNRLNIGSLYKPNRAMTHTHHA